MNNKLIYITVDLDAYETYKSLCLRKVRLNHLISEYIRSLSSKTDSGDIKIALYDDGYAAGYATGIEKSSSKIKMLKKLIANGGPKLKKERPERQRIYLK